MDIKPDVLGENDLRVMAPDTTIKILERYKKEL